MPKNTATANNDTDAQVALLIEEVTKRKAELQSIERYAWKTNCSFPVNEEDRNHSWNLHVVPDTRRLILIAAHLRTMQVMYEETATMLNIIDPPAFSWGGYSAQDWLDDIEQRAKKIQIEARKKMLAKLEDRLNAIISPELKRKMELDAILAELK